MTTKIKIQIKNRWTGSVLFEYEKEDNTIKDTLVEAVKQDADLGGADLGDWGKLQDIIIIGPIGSRKAYTTCYKTDKGIYVKCGCFSGTLDEFVAKVKKTHNDNTHERDYLALVEFVKIKFLEGEQ